MIYDPMRDEMFMPRTASGAVVNGTAVCASRPAQLADAVSATASRSAGTRDLP